MSDNYFNDLGQGSKKIRAIDTSLKEIQKAIENYQKSDDLSDLTYEELCEVLKNAETICNYTRRAMSDKNTQNYVIVDVQNKGKEYQRADVMSEVWLLKELEEKEGFHLKSLPVSVDYNDGLITIHTPLTFKRGYKKSKYFVNYNLAYNLKAALKLWQEQHEKSLVDVIELPYILVMKRVDTEYKKSKIFDADNIENQRIINAFSVGLNLPDNAPNMKLFSCFEVDNDEKNIGTFFYIFSEKDFEKYKYLFKTNTIKVSVTEENHKENQED